MGAGAFHALLLLKAHILSPKAMDAKCLLRNSVPSAEAKVSEKCPGAMGTS